MKGVILVIAPGATIVDVSHVIAPQNILQGAYVLGAAFRYFPAGTIHVVVVDPGVGTSRRPIAVEAGGHVFVAPDNGVVAPALESVGALDPEDGRLTSGAGVILENPEYRRRTVSDTFHGRDIFAPAAAHLASGVPIPALGPSIDALVRLPQQATGVKADEVTGTVIHIDHFGNAITNLTERILPAHPVIFAGNARIEGLARSYQASELVALIGSTGLLEVAVRNGNAAESLHLQVGDAVTVRNPE